MATAEARRGPGYERFRQAMPLSEFGAMDADYVEWVEWQVAQPEKPERWVVVCEGMVKVESRAWYEWHWRRGIYPGGGTRPPLPQRTRQLVIDRDGYFCGLCGGEVAPDDLHIDHIQPWSLGGSDDLDNLQVAHARCNISKGNRI